MTLLTSKFVFECCYLTGKDMLLFKDISVAFTFSGIPVASCMLSAPEYVAFIVLPKCDLAFTVKPSVIFTVIEPLSR